MKIVFITQKFPPRELGGADLETYLIAKHVQELGFDISVICTDEINDRTVPAGAVREEYDPYDGIPVWRLSYNWETMPDPYWSLYGINAPVEEAIRKRIRALQSELAHVTSCGMITAAAISAPIKEGLPVVVTLTGKWEICPVGTLLKDDRSICAGRQEGVTCLRCLFGETQTARVLMKLPGSLRKGLYFAVRNSLALSKLTPGLNFIRTVERRNQELQSLLEQVDLIQSPSYCHIGVFSATGMIPQERIIYSPHGRDLSNIQKKEARREGKQTLTIGFTGQIVPHKGLDTLIEAFLRLPEDFPAELHIYGDPEKDPGCRSTVALGKGKKNIHWKGRYQSEQLSDVFATLDVVVVPSKCVENSPGTIAEAFAAGVPVIGSDVCGVSEHIRDGVDGLLFERGNPEALAVQLRRLVEEPGLLEHLRSNARQPRSIEDYAWEFAGIFTAILQDRKKTAGILTE